MKKWIVVFGLCASLTLLIQSQADAKKTSKQESPDQAETLNTMDSGQKIAVVTKKDAKKICKAQKLKGKAYKECVNNEMQRNNL